MLTTTFDANGSDIIWSIYKHPNLKLWQHVSETSAYIVDKPVYLLKD
jgi:hypothetical protein